MLSFGYAGMQTQLRLTNTEYSIALTVTYISFIFAEWPSVMFCKKLCVYTSAYNWKYHNERIQAEHALFFDTYSGFHIGLPALCVAWGLVCTFQGFVTSYGGLVAARESS